MVSTGGDVVDESLVDDMDGAVGGAGGGDEVGSAGTGDVNGDSDDGKVPRDGDGDDEARLHTSRSAALVTLCSYRNSGNTRVRRVGSSRFTDGDGDGGRERGGDNGNGDRWAAGVGEGIAEAGDGGTADNDQYTSSCGFWREILEASTAFRRFMCSAVICRIMTVNASKRSSHSRHLKESASAISFFATTGWTCGSVGDGAVLCGGADVDDGTGVVDVGDGIGMDVGIGDGVGVGVVNEVKFFKTIDVWKKEESNRSPGPLVHIFFSRLSKY